MFFHVVALDIFDGGANQGVNFAAAFDEEAVVSHALGEGILEHVLQFREEVLLDDQLRPLEGLEPRVKRVG